MNTSSNSLSTHSPDNPLEKTPVKSKTMASAKQLEKVESENMIKVESANDRDHLEPLPELTAVDDEPGLYGGFCPGGSWSGGICQPFNNNRTHWMSTYGGVRNLPIHLAILPGTHNSGFDYEAKQTPSMEVCQDVSPHKQLNAGIRVLDIRVEHYFGLPAGDPRRFMIFHSTNNGRTIKEDIIKGVRDFHYGPGWDRRKEIVILDFHQFKGFTPAAHAELAALLKSSFGDSIISPTYKELSISQIWALPGFKNVVIAYNSGNRDSSFWPGVNQRWIGTNTPSDSELKAFIDRVGNEVKPTGELRSIQAARMVLPFFVPKDISTSIMNWFAAGSASHPIMKYFIINSDFSLRHRLVDNVIYSNQFRTRALGLSDVTEATPVNVGAFDAQAARHMVLRVSDEQWAPIVDLPPIADEQAHRLLVCSDASRDCVLRLQGSDVPSGRIPLIRGDNLAFVCLDGSRRWQLQVQDYQSDACGPFIPLPVDGEKFARYTAGADLEMSVAFLPDSAPDGTVIWVIDQSDVDLRIRYSNEQRESEFLLSAGDSRAFIYNRFDECWEVQGIQAPSGGFQLRHTTGFTR